MHACLFGTLEYVVPVKSKVEISQNYVAFSEYMNFNYQENSLVSETRINISHEVYLLASQ